MHIHIEHFFPAAARAEVERLYMLDDEFNRQAFDGMGYTREVVARALEGQLLTRSLLLTPHKGLSGAFGALTPKGMFSINEQVSYDFARHHGHWQTTPSVLSGQFKASGTLSISERPGGVLFTLEGEAVAHLPLLSRRAEKQAVQTAHEQHTLLAAAVRARIDTAHSQLQPSAARP